MLYVRVSRQDTRGGLQQNIFDVTAVETETSQQVCYRKYSRLDCSDTTKIVVDGSTGEFESEELLYMILGTILGKDRCAVLNRLKNVRCEIVQAPTPVKSVKKARFGGALRAPLPKGKTKGERHE